MAIRVRDLYEQICDCLLEPGELTGKTVTNAVFIDALNIAITDVLSVGCWPRVTAILAELGVRVYDENPPSTSVKEALIDHQSMNMNSGFYWDNYDGYWQNQPPGTPQEWRKDQLTNEQIELRPAPAWTGYDIQYDNLGYLGTLSALSGISASYDPEQSGMYGTVTESDKSEVPLLFTNPGFGTISHVLYTESNITEFAILPQTSEVSTLDDVIEINVSFTPLLRFMVLKNIFESDTEARSVQSAKYFTGREQEAINLLSSVCQERLN